jgi:hypothetical protein
MMSDRAQNKSRPRLVPQTSTHFARSLKAYSHGPNLLQPSHPSLRIDSGNGVDRSKRREYVSVHGGEFQNSSISGGIAVNTKRLMFLFAFAASLILLSDPVFAHHSTAEYDMTALTSIKGTVTKFEWSNPHAYIYMQVKDDKGVVVEWTAEMASLGMLSRVNWKRDTVKPGDEITIYGNRAKDGRTVMRLDKVAFANGQELSAHVG